MNGMYNNDYYGGYQQPDYLLIKQTQFRGLRKNSMILAALLILYNLLIEISSRMYIYIYYAAKSGQFTLDRQVIADYVNNSSNDISVTEFEMFGNAFVTLVSLLAILIVAKLIFRIGPSEYMKPDANGLKTGLIAFPFSMLLNFIFSLLTSIVSSFFGSMGIIIPEAEFVVDKPTFIAGFSMFSYMVILAPIIEEIVYRGFVMKLLAPYGKTAAVFFSAFIFGFMHGNFSQFVTAFATGVVYASVAVYCGSIIPTIIMHMLNNGLNFLTICGNDYGVEQLLTLFSILFVMVVMLGIAEIFIYRKVLKKREMSMYVLTSQERLEAMLLNIPMLIYLAYLTYEFIYQIVAAN